MLSRLTAKIPPHDANSHDWPYLTGLQLADPDFSRSKPIHIIVGSDSYGSVILPGLMRDDPSLPIAQQTVFGWTISGAILAEGAASTAQAHHCALDHELQELISRFWSQEEVPASMTSQLTEDEMECEGHFVTTHSRDASGRYIVRLLLKLDPAILGDSKPKALSSLNNFRKDSNSILHFGSATTNSLRSIKDWVI